MNAKFGIRMMLPLRLLEKSFLIVAKLAKTSKNRPNELEKNEKYSVHNEVMSRTWDKM